MSSNLWGFVAFSGSYSLNFSNVIVFTKMVIKFYNEFSYIKSKLTSLRTTKNKLAQLNAKSLYFERFSSFSF